MKTTVHCDNKNGTLHEDRYIYIYESISLNSSYTEIFRQNLYRKSKHILCLVTFSERQAIYEIMWKNTVQPHSTHMAI